MKALVATLDTIVVLLVRDLLRFVRQPTRLVGALGQPIIFWGVIGAGMRPTFHLPDSGGDYLTFFFPGVVLMVVLFSSIFAAVSVIEDRHQGFLQAVLVAPAPRIALVIGKALGASLVALAQVALFLLLLPRSGLPLDAISWGTLLVVLLLSSFALCALGFAVAWGIDSTQGYHAVQMTLLVPLWVISGAMFPVPQQGGLWAQLLALNPLAWANTAVRHALWGGSAPAATILPLTQGEAVVRLVLLAAATLTLASYVARAPRRSATSRSAAPGVQKS